MTLPERANYSLTESDLSPFPVQPAQNYYGINGTYICPTTTHGFGKLSYRLTFAYVCEERLKSKNTLSPFPFS